MGENETLNGFFLVTVLCFYNRFEVSHQRECGVSRNKREKKEMSRGMHGIFPRQIAFECN